MKVGDKLWYRAYDARSDAARLGREVTVNWIGRKWAAIDHGERVDIKSMAVDGGQYSSPGRCYLSEAHYIAETARACTWHRLAQAVYRGRVPDHVTEAAINKAAELLGINIAK